VRPALVDSTPASLTQPTAPFNVSLTGGFFAPAVTTAIFNGFPGTNTGISAGPGFINSRQLMANIPAGAASTPGLYSIVVQNTGIASGSSTAATNLSITPAAGTLLTSPTATVGVGSGPTAIAVDQADGLAVVANTGSNSVSIINLTS